MTIYMSKTWIELIDIGLGAAVGSTLSILTYYCMKRMEYAAMEEKIGKVTDIVESIKTSLSHYLFKENFHHERLVEIVENLYAKVQMLDLEIEILTGNLRVGGKEHRILQFQKTLDSHRDFAHYYLKNKLYLEPELCELIEKIMKRSGSILFETEYEIHHAPQGEEYQQIYHRVKKLSKEELPLFIKQIDQELRKLISLENKKG
jgi:hypothetical protein